MANLQLHKLQVKVRRQLLTAAPGVRIRGPEEVGGGSWGILQGHSLPARQGLPAGSFSLWF